MKKHMHLTQVNATIRGNNGGLDVSNIRTVYHLLNGTFLEIRSADAHLPSADGLLPGSALCSLSLWKSILRIHIFL